MYTGLSPISINLVGLTVKVQSGFNFCAPFIPKTLLENLIAAEIRNAVENQMINAFNLGGLRDEFLGLIPFIQEIPNRLFSAVKLNRQDIIDVLKDPFNGIKITVFFNEDNNDTGDNEYIRLTIDVPWESFPIAKLNVTADGYFRYRFNASGSYDPDGGSIVRYEWNYGDGVKNSTSTPIVVHTYSTANVYRAILTVVDNEGVRSSITRSVKVGDGGRNFPEQ